MANVTQLRNGSTGAEVKKLQQALINAGYDVGKTGADGVLGKNTEAAIKQYQRDNGLAVDGIAGNSTQEMLYSTPARKNITNNNAASTNTATGVGNSQGNLSDKKVGGKQEGDYFLNGTEYANTHEQTAQTNNNEDGFYYNPYEESDAVREANELLQQWMSNKPGEYQSQWSDELADYLNQIQNRGEFSYDFNSDALYQQYKDSYIQQGRMAMMDTMGQAASMTGGYGNSYAQNVGQQAYNQQLNQLNNIMPELYQTAYNRYADEGQQLMNMYNMYLDQENQDYSRYQTDLGNWYDQLQYLTDRYETERSIDYGRWQDSRDQAYDEYLADLEDARWQAEFDESNRRYEDSKYSSYSSGSGGSSGSNDTGNSGISLAHVSSMSSYELVGYLESYNKQGNNTGLEAFLDDCVLSGRLTQEQADAYYAQYRTGDSGYQGPEVPEDNQEEKRSAGGGGNRGLDPFKKKAKD